MRSNGKLRLPVRRQGALDGQRKEAHGQAEKRLKGQRVRRDIGGHIQLKVAKKDMPNGKHGETRKSLKRGIEDQGYTQMPLEKGTLRRRRGR